MTWLDVHGEFVHTAATVTQQVTSAYREDGEVDAEPVKCFPALLCV